MDSWTEVGKLLNRTLKTLDRNRPFKVVAITDNALLIRPEASGKDRLIDRREVEDSLSELRRRGEITRSEIQENYSPRNPAYVAAILAALSGVRVSVRPIVLRYKTNVE